MQKTTASTTDMLVLLCGLLLACSDGKGPSKPGDRQASDSGTSLSIDSAPTGDTSVPVETADTGDSPPGDTGLASSCDSVAASPGIRLCGNEEGDFTGRWLDAADIDGDGLADLLISESWDAGEYGLGGIHTAAHVVKYPMAAGNLHEIGFATFEGSGESNGMDYWGSPLALLPETSQIVVGGQPAGTLDYTVHVLDVPSTAGTSIPAAAEVATMFAGPPNFNELGTPVYLSRCDLSDGAAALCVGAINTNYDISGNYAGQTIVFELPLPSEFHVIDDARARYLGDDFDRAEQIEGQHDLDGDGVHDLVIGAYWARGSLGAVAVLLEPPDGVHRLWDVASATLVGVDVNAQFGGGTGVGDLDNDGYADLLIGAYFGDAGAAYVFRGPFSGERTADTAEWQITGQTGDWLGVDGLIGDVDGDAAGDLVLGAPRSIYVGTEPGQVLIWTNPAPGVFDAATAPIALTSGVGQPDGFGLALEGADLDGDGRMDLAIGAPRDPTIGDYGGSVTVVFGASL